jgi:hypothetical protein
MFYFRLLIEANLVGAGLLPPWRLTWDYVITLGFGAFGRLWSRGQADDCFSGGSRHPSAPIIMILIGIILFRVILGSESAA